ncbi:MAG: hypothetical protein ACKVS8_04375 [Phycisphaerales bacterium]
MSKSKSRRDGGSDARRWAKRGQADQVSATELQSRAGAAPFSGNFEQLEKRELLFALSVDPSYSLRRSGSLDPGVAQNTFLDDPATALLLPALARGSAYSRFGYVLPFFQRQVPASGFANSLIETFTDLGEDVTAPLELPTTQLFEGSGFVVESLNYDLDPTTIERRASIVTLPPNPSPTDTAPTSELLLQIAGMNQIQFSVLDEETSQRQFLRSFVFNINLRAQTEMRPPGSLPGPFESGPIGSLAPAQPDPRNRIHVGPPLPNGNGLVNPKLPNDPTALGYIEWYDLDRSPTGTKITLFRGTRAVETFFGVGTVDDPTTQVIESPITLARTPDVGVGKPPLGPAALGPRYTLQPSDGQSVFDSIVIERIDTTDRQFLGLSGSPTGGTFTLTSDTFPAGETAPIPFNASAAQVQAALLAMQQPSLPPAPPFPGQGPVFAPGDVVVTGPNGGPWQLTYSDTAAARVAFGTSTGLTGGSTPAVILTLDTDQILIQNVIPELQTGRFATMVADRVAGAQVGISGSIGGVQNGSQPRNGTYVSGEETFTTVPTGAVILGQPFANSRLQVDQVAPNISAAQVVAGGLGAGNQLTFTNNEGTALTFSFRDDRGNARPLRNFTFYAPAFGQPGAINPASDLIQLFRNGRLVRAFTPADLTGAPIITGTTTPSNPIAINSLISLAGPVLYTLDTFSESNPMFPLGNFRNEAFDEVRFQRATGSGSSALAIDAVSGFFPPMVEFFDLYGRPIVETLSLPVPSGRSPAPAVDQNDDGVPDFNDGIGRIVISNARSDTNFAIVGGTITYEAGEPTGTPPIEGFFRFQFPTNADGLFQQFQQNSFGHFVEPPEDNDDTNPIVFGLPAAGSGGGSVVVGSPFARDNRSTDRYLGYFRNTNLTEPRRSSFAGSRGGNAAGLLDITSSTATLPGIAFPGSVDARQDLQFSRTFIENTLVDATGAPVLGDPTLGATPLFQGVFVADGQSVGDVKIDGALYGSSRFGGAVRSLLIGYLPGSLTVNGDLGALTVRSFSGAWFDLPAVQGQGGATIPNGNGNGPGLYSTGTQILVGRSAGQLSLGTINLANVQILNDRTNPLFSALDFTEYAEKEVIQGATSLDAILGDGGDLDDGAKQYALLFGAFFDPETDQFTFGSTGSNELVQIRFPFSINRTNFITSTTASVAVGVTDPRNTPDLSSTGITRNDTVLGGEFIGSPTGTIRLGGVLGGFGPVSTAEDNADVFGFAAIGGQRVDTVILFGGALAPRFAAKVVDSRGRTLANFQSGFVTGDRTADSQSQPDIVSPFLNSVRFSFTPDATDAYYLVFSRPPSTVSNGFMGYEATVTGLPNLSLGMFSQVGGLAPNSISVAGSVGLMRFGAATNNNDGVLFVPPRPGTESDNDYLTTRRLQLTVNGDLHALLFGGAVDTSSQDELSSIRVTGNLGVLRTGVNPLAGIGATAGDFAAGVITVGGTIGEMDINGALGARQNPFPDLSIEVGPVGPVRITSGTSGGPGDIGGLLIGTYVAADRVQVRTSAGSTIDRFIVGTQGPGSTAFTGSIRLNQPSLLFAAGTNIRFADFSQVASGSSGFPVDTDSIIALPFGQSITLADATGTPFVISVAGGTNAGGNSGAQIIALPIAGAGLVIGRIQAQLSNGSELRIGSLGGTAIGIGRIQLNLVNGGTLRGGSIIIGGASPIDILRLEVTGGALDRIVNATVGGDIVSADVLGVRTVHIAGNLGSTNTTPGMRRKIGHFLGLAQGEQGAVGGVIGVPGFVNNWNGTTYEGLLAFSPTTPNTGDQVGLPYDPFLDGLLVRGGNVENVSVAGSIGDVLLTGVGATLRLLVPNFNQVSVPGVFNGIVGSIYAQNIINIDVGDGLAGPGESGIANAGIFANGSIQAIRGGYRVLNPVVSGVIIASGLGGAAPGSLPGINGINIRGGRIDGAFIGGASLDSFWRAPRGTLENSTGNIDDPTATATVASVVGIGTVMFRSTVFGTAIGTVNLHSGSVFDASSVIARGTTVVAPGQGTAIATLGSVQQIIVDEFRNSTLTGEGLEFRPNQIIASDIVRYIASARDIADLEITTPNDLVTLTARNATRLILNIGNIARVVSIRGDLRSSTLNVGRLESLGVSGNVLASTIRSTGMINSITISRNATNTSIVAVGAGGRINSLNVIGSFSGDITSNGPINALAANGDFTGSVTIVSTVDGTLNSIRSGGDLAVSLSVPLNVNSISSGGIIGRRVAQGATSRDVIDIKGNLGSVTARGQIYADLRVGQAITGGVTVGRTSALPGADFVSDFVITAAGRIASVNITGDFRGSILSQSGGIGSVNITGGSLVGSARAANAIEARDGDIGSVTVSRGHILGSISARDGSINAINVIADAAGFGNIGVDPTLAAGVIAGIPAAERRGQLPPGFVNTAGRDGPRIFAGLDIVSLNVGRSIFESSIQAGRRVGNVSVLGNIDGNANPIAANASFIVAGDEIGSVSANGTRAVGTASARGTIVAAGILSLGTDNLPGGVGAAADLVKSGIVSSVAFRFDAVGTAVYAGLEAGPNGVFEQGGGDDTVAPGLSTITSVTITRGTIAGVSIGNFAFAKTRIVSVSAPAGALTATQASASTNVAITGLTTAAPRVTGTPAPEFVGDPVALGYTPIPVAGLPVVIGAAAATLRYSGGANQAFYDALGTRIVIVNSTTGSLTVDGLATANIAGLGIITGRNASLASITVRPQLSGASNIYVDGSVGSATFGLVTLTPGNRFRAGESFGTVSIGARDPAAPAAANPTNLVALAANSFTSVTFLNGYGVSSNSRIDARRLGNFTVTGTFNGVVSSDFDITGVRVNGAFNGRVRSGGSIGSFSSTTATNARLTARDNLGSVVVSGAADGFTVYAGTDLGGDADFGGVGANILGTANADTVTNGNIASVSIGGNFTRSDVAAGRSRGVDGFINRPGDLVAAGRSNIGPVRIAGAVGSIQQTQTYGVFASGTLGTTFVGNFNLTGSLGNFTRRATVETATPLQVVSLTVENPGIFSYVARVVFNQNINPGAGNANLLAALTIAEQRDGGFGTAITLAGATDFSSNNDTNPANDVEYAVSYNPNTFTATITFSRTVTDRALLGPTDQVTLPGGNVRTSPGAPSRTLAGPGVYKFSIASTLTGATVTSTLDGNGDGVSTAGDTFTRNALVGDAGDRSGNYRDGATSLYAATDLGLLLNTDRPANNGAPDVNTPYTLRGTIGDNAAILAQGISGSSDIDVFALPLRAGQILRFGELGGTAALATRAIYDNTFLVEDPTAGTTDPVRVRSSALASSSGLTLDTLRPIVGLPQRFFADTPSEKLLRLIDPSDTRNASESFLVRQTGVYYIAVGSSETQLAVPAANLPPSATNFTGIIDVGIHDPNVTEIPITQGNLGDYNFAITIEDSGSSGFFGTAVPQASSSGFSTGSTFSPAGIGAPLAADFLQNAGTDAIVGTADDVLAPFIERFELVGGLGNDVDGVPFGLLNKWIFQLVPDANGLFGVQPDGSVAGNVRGTNARGVIGLRDPAINGGAETEVRTPAAGAVPTSLPAAGDFSAPVGALASTPITRTTIVQSFPSSAAVAVPGVAGVPAPFQFQRFAGADFTFGTADDYIVGSDTFDRVAGVDGILSNADDTLTPTARVGTTVRISGGPDGILGNADDVTRTTTDAGDGALLVTSPRPSDFFPTAAIPAAGTILPSIVRGEWTFTLEPGGANKTYQGNGTLAVRSNDRVVGTNNRGTRYTVSAGADGRFNTLALASTDDATTVDSSLGRRGLNGTNTTTVAPDLDVFHLDNGSSIAAGTRFRITLKATDTSANLGLLAPLRDQLGNFTALRLFDTRGAVQIGLFDTTFNNDFSTAAVGVEDFGSNITNSALIASTSGQGGYAGARTTTVSNGITGYGTDANGDTFIDVVAPRALNPEAASLGAGNANGTFAVFVQGATRSDYRVEIVRMPAVAAAATPRTQNVLIETAGGQITWLEANPYSPTVLGAFDPAFNALDGLIGGVSPLTYIIDASAAANPAGGVVQRLRSLFNIVPGFVDNVADANGSFGTIGTVRFSTNAADFEGQSYSTVYITSSPEPASMTTSLLSTLVFGASQKVDAFNSNANDEAVVFARAFNVLANGVGASGADLLINEITAAAARRVGELLGMRIVSDTSLDILNSGSVTNARTGFNASFLARSSPLSGQQDLIRSTDFFLGQQRSVGLLNRILLGV